MSDACRHCQANPPGSALPDQRSDFRCRACGAVGTWNGLNKTVVTEQLMHAYLAFQSRTLEQRDPPVFTVDETRILGEEIASEFGLNDADRTLLFKAINITTVERNRLEKVLASLDNHAGKALEGDDWSDEVDERVELLATVEFTSREAEVMAAWAQAKGPLHARLITLMLKHGVDGLDENGVLTPAGKEVIHREVQQMDPITALSNLYRALHQVQEEE